MAAIGSRPKANAMCACGMNVRGIRGPRAEIHGLDVCPDLIRRVTGAVLDEGRKGRSRALDAVSPVGVFDALRVKIRDTSLSGHCVARPCRSMDSRIVKNKAVYLALGVPSDVRCEVSGLWIAGNDGAKFWLAVMTELRNRGVQDILIAVVDGLKGFPEATVQTCIVHLGRQSRNLCSWKDRKAVAATLGDVYSAETVEAAWDALAAFGDACGKQYPSIAQAWRRAWQEAIPFFTVSLELRRVIDTTNAVERPNQVIRTSIRTRGSFPSEDAAEDRIQLAIRGPRKPRARSEDG